MTDQQLLDLDGRVVEDRTRVTLPSPYPDPEPGIYRHLPEHVYHGDPRWAGLVSSSKLKVLAFQTPEDLRWQMDHPAEGDTDFTAFGSAFHAAVLQPERVDELVAIAPFDATPRTKVAKAELAEFEAANAGKAILRPWKQVHDLALLDEMVRRVNAHPTASVWLDGERELTIVVEINGVMVKIRGDALPRFGGPTDLKSTRSAHPNNFRRQGHDLGYHIQGGLYRRVVRIAVEQQLPIHDWAGDGGTLGALDIELDTVTDFRFVAVERSWPPKITCASLAETDLELGERLVDKALDDWRYCNETGDWPGYPTSPQVIAFPMWARKLDEALLDEEMEIDDADI